MTESPYVLPSVAVVIPTYNRPDRVRDCLAHLEKQSVRPDRVVVVDSSADTRTEQLVRALPAVVYARNPMGRGHTPESRALGVSLTKEEVVAFLDDDANAHPDWLANLVARYADPEVAGVGGSALNGISGERGDGIGSIGLLLPDGRLTGFFAADPGKDVEVDHLLGANMSFRRTAIDAVGGFHGGYPGTCIREESDLALRLRKLGRKLIYTPAAVVDHLPGEYAKGKRFDRRYVFYAHRNSVVLLARVYGLRSAVLGRYVVTALREVLAEVRRGLSGVKHIGRVGARQGLRTLAGGLSKALVITAGLVAGCPAALAAIRGDEELLRARSAPAAG